MRVIGVFLLSVQIMLGAFWPDDLYLHRAMSAYTDERYQDAFDLFSKVEKKESRVFYNMANCLYRLQKYPEAIELYLKVENSHEKLHNIANSYVALHSCKNAVNYYELALRYQDDERTKFNLARCKKELEEMWKKKMKEKKNMEKAAGGGNADGSESDSKGDSPVEAQGKGSGKESALKADSQTPNENTTGAKEPQGKGNKGALINAYHTNKWDNQVKNQKIRTLLIPLEKGESGESRQPW